MEVRRYVQSDFLQISEWAKDYGSEYSLEQLPKTGFIVDGIAAYFLYSTDSSVCFLENMISNKKVSQLEKEEALDLIVDAILNEATELGFKIAYATTWIPAVAVRAAKCGAKVQLNQMLLTKKLNTRPIE